jgi:hypothetical protein
LFHAQSDAFDLVCESLSIVSLMVIEGLKRKWPLPGGMPLLLELLPTVFLHVYRVLCVHKLKFTLSQTAIGHGYTFGCSAAKLLAPSPMEQAMLDKNIPLKTRNLQVHAEASCKWPASTATTTVDCIRLLHVRCPAAQV